MKDNSPAPIVPDYISKSRPVKPSKAEIVSVTTSRTPTGLMVAVLYRNGQMGVGTSSYDPMIETFAQAKTRAIASATPWLDVHVLSDKAFSSWENKVLLGGLR